ILGRCRCPNRDPPCACSVWEAWPYWRCGGASASWIGGSAATLVNLQRAELREIVWRTCKVIARLDKTNAFKEVHRVIGFRRCFVIFAQSRERSFYAI